MKKGKTPHNKTNAMRRSMEKNRELNTQQNMRNNKKSKMFSSIKDIK